MSESGKGLDKKTTVASALVLDLARVSSPFSETDEDSFDSHHDAEGEAGGVGELQLSVRLCKNGRKRSAPFALTVSTNASMIPNRSHPTESSTNSPIFVIFTNSAHEDSLLQGVRQNYCLDSVRLGFRHYQAESVRQGSPPGTLQDRQVLVVHPKVTPLVLCKENPRQPRRKGHIFPQELSEGPLGSRGEDQARSAQPSLEQTPPDHRQSQTGHESSHRYNDYSNECLPRSV